jgi:UPF0271 protein
MLSQLSYRPRGGPWYRSLAAGLGPPTMYGMKVDLNADVGESFAAWTMGDDEALLPLVTSASIACGAHAGDPVVMDRTVALCQRLGVSIGAHPAYPDLAGFGRRDLDLPTGELRVSLLAQIGALASIAHARGAELWHVKPHGALYNRAAADASVGGAVAEAVHAFSADLVLIGPPGSTLLSAARDIGLPTAAEGYADRSYEVDGSLRSRRLPGAVHDDPATAASQAVSIMRDGCVRTHSGDIVLLQVDTLCVHGDSPNAVAIARAVRSALEVAGIEIGTPW